MNDTTETRTQAPRSNGELRKSLNDVVNAAEALLRATVNETNAEYHKARKVLNEKLSAVKVNVAEQAHEIAADAREIGTRGDRLVHDNPWLAIGIGAGAGLLLGLILRRR